jgi:hypothetical protein
LPAGELGILRHALGEREHLGAALCAEDHLEALVGALGLGRRLHHLSADLGGDLDDLRPSFESECGASQMRQLLEDELYALFTESRDCFLELLEVLAVITVLLAGDIDSPTGRVEPRFEHA